MNGAVDIRLTGRRTRFSAEALLTEDEAPGSWSYGGPPWPWQAACPVARYCDIGFASGRSAGAWRAQSV